MTGGPLCTRELERSNLKFGMSVHSSPTEAEFAPNPNNEGSIVIYTGNIGSRLASAQLLAYAEVLKVMQILWDEVSRDPARVAELLAE